MISMKALALLSLVSVFSPSSFPQKTFSLLRGIVAVPSQALATWYAASCTTSSCLLQSAFTAALLLGSPFLQAQTVTPADVEQTIEARYALTKTTADRSDIVTQGAVLVLQKDGLLMCATTTGSPAQNNYKDGKISQGIWKVVKAPKIPGVPWVLSHAGVNATVTTRTFVTGEKLSVTNVTVKPDGVVLDLFSDSISDTRYYATLKFPFPKDAYPSGDQVAASVGEVLKVQPAEDTAASENNTNKPSAADTASAAATPPAPMAPIPPPPPPTDAAPVPPKIIALSQTKDVVVAKFGQPTKVAKIGIKEIDYYPDMKVTFVNNKVTDVTPQ